MNAEIADLLATLRRELWRKRRLFAVLYLLTSFLFLFVGWNWPKVYSSSSTILVDQQNILQPLMAGTAVTTALDDRAKLAREVIYSRRALEKVLESLGELKSNYSDLEIERKLAEVESRAWVQNAGQNIIKIGFDDGDAHRAFKVASLLSDIFVNDSLEAKQKESRDAYEFINGQVVEYHKKLKEAEEALKVFQSKNLDATPGSQDTVNARIIDLRRSMESTQLEIRELKIQRETLQKQLSGEAAITEDLTKEGQIRTRLAALEEQLSTLRLSYHDDYPDIIRIKSMIESQERELRQAEQERQSEERQGRSGISPASTTSLLYQKLRTEFTETETKLASLNARLEETRGLLKDEQDRLIRINGVEATLSELMRDYQVNQDVYQSLLRQRENARISMNIDKEQQGLTFKVQEPAALQLTPKGIRFAHFLAAGFVFSFLVPIGIVYGLTLLDRRIRSARYITETLGLPVLASVYHMNTPVEYNVNTFKKSIIVAAILVSWAVYGYAVWLRINGTV